jgi:diguanylate cyclase (GGDEF)-like protein
LAVRRGSPRRKSIERSAPSTPDSAAGDAGRAAQLLELGAELPLALWTADAELRLTSLAGAALGSLELEATVWLGRPLGALLGAEAESAHRRALAGERVALEVTVRGRRLELRLGSLRDERGRVVACGGFALDLTERRRAEEELARRATRDPLTGLLNRAAFEERLGEAVASARRDGPPVALLSAGLDHFRAVNDSLGHAAGDEALREVAARFAGALRLGDSLARTGGDEFGLILTRLERPDDAAGVAERLLEALGDPIRLGGREVSLRASVGIALYPRDGADAASLHRHADVALGQAKAAGRGGHRFYEPEAGRAAEERLALERDLRRALEAGEFELHYQPQLDMRRRAAFGFEALIRWRHPERGLVLPGSFIPLAEESGLVVPIGAWALGEACRQARAWQAAGLPPVKLAVNVSGLQFDRRDLVETVARALEGSGLAPHWLDLELTESLVMRDVEGSARQMARLRALGVSLSVDDFGTGYSSLSYLQQLPIDTLKIDRSFVAEVEDSWGTRPLVEAIVGLARGLGLGLVAEGVETADQLEALLALGCERGQGYLFAKPLRAAEAERFLAAGAPS